MNKSWRWYVYILELKNGYYYTGMTWSADTRYEQHLSGQGSKYTAKYGVKQLVYAEIHDNLETARMREIQIKNFSQKKKRQLIKTFEGLG